ncbi:MAG: hypothetical protein A3K66_05405 [Euryarchaeota archaeon RBG_16_67_27]|nr:MAG: hypothetical protein A3K66_05405 [Euryarchaeota archaeon RBG_16_67_27]
MRRGILALALLAALAALAFAPPAAGQEVFTDIRGPAALSPGQVGQFNVSISGGPAGPDVNYTLEFYITGTDTTGGAPTSASPGHASGSQALHTINVTAPQVDQTVTLIVKISAKRGSITENATVEKAIVIVTPIVLSATFVNGSPTAAVNVTVRFYVDDALVGTQTLARIAGNGQATASFSYLPANLAAGTHRVRIEADIDRNGAIDPARGELATSELFIREAAPLSSGWTLVLGIAAFVPVFLVAAALRRRNR